MNRRQTLVPSVLIVLLAAALMLLLAFRSCAGQEAGSQSTKAADAVVDLEKTGRAGQYEITAMVTEGKETTPEDLTLLKGKGLTCTMTLQSNGTGVLDLFGEETSLTWDETTISTGEKDMPYTFQDGQLTITDGNSSLTFSRTE